jgi:hypothetical protein
MDFLSHDLQVQPWCTRAYGYNGFFQGVYTIVTNAYDAYDTTDGRFDHVGAYVIHQQAFRYMIGMSTLWVLQCAPFDRIDHIASTLLSLGFARDTSRSTSSCPLRRLLLRFEHGMQHGLLVLSVGLLRSTVLSASFHESSVSSLRDPTNSSLRGHVPLHNSNSALLVFITCLQNRVLHVFQVHLFSNVLDITNLILHFWW